FLIGGLVVVLLSAMATSSSYAVYLREHKPVRSYLNPASILWSTGAYLAQNDARAGPLVFPGGKTTRVLQPGKRPLVVFLVVGETARAANFQLGGYSRHTNPRLQAIPDLIYYPKASACGTSTAVSLPCIFSHLGRQSFDSAGKMNYANLVDMLASADIDVEWRDNNSGCKGVCARVPVLDYFRDGSSWRTPQQCSHAHCYDEVMLLDLPERLRNLQRDTVIVFHQNGSHGPAYGERYPQQFEVFKPACHSAQIDSCSREELVNAYDNSILYTDYNLAQQIDLLRQAADHIDGALLFASDHGESLGEQGVYLHGMPYSFAPAQQKEVPFLLWMSPGIEKRLGLAAGCLSQHREEAVSHDNMFHTVLGLMAASNGVYDRHLDLLSPCRR
ncbi:MAG TPA: sulfatase-like hydrolase/transferase, partial [Steroidobacteraceae bacterium]|nr:sulfatase-like hydrolase/transferase [Steroidobacteraceae bacterium]